MNDLSINKVIGDRIFFSLLVTVLWLILPVASVFLIIYLIYKVDARYYSIRYLLLLIALTFGLVAYTAVSVDRGGEPTDITRYTTQFKLLAGIETPAEFLFTIILGDGGLYIIFGTISLVLAKLFPTNPQVLPLFWVSFAYFFLALAVYELSQYKKEWSKNTFIILLLVLLFGTTFFSYEVELLKQSSATGLMAYIVFRKLNGKKYSGWLFVIAFLIHTSVIVFLPILLLVKKQYINRYYIFILGTCALFSLVDLNKVVAFIGPAALANKAKFYVKIESWTITKLNYTMFALYILFMILIVLDARRRDKSREINRLAFNANIMAFSLLLMQFHSIHNFVRFNYLYSPFYLLAFFYVLTGTVEKKSRLIIASFFLVFMIGLNGVFMWMYLNSTYANSFMDDSLTKLFSSSVYSFLKYNAVN